MAYVFPGFVTPELTKLLFPKPPTTFLTYFNRREKRKYAGKKFQVNRVSNSQSPGHESDTLATEERGARLNSLPNDKILDQSKLKAFADYRLKVIHVTKFVLDKIENIVGKEENAGHQHFLHFP